VAIEKKEQQWCPRDEERFFFFSVQRPQSLFLCIFLPLTSPSLLLFLDDDGGVGVTGRNSGGDGGGYADRSRWFFLSSVSLLVSAFSVLSLSLHPQNSSVRSSLSHQKLPPVLIFLSAQKPPLTLSFASLFLQNFAPLIAGSSSGIYKQRRRGLPYPCHGAG